MTGIQWEEAGALPHSCLGIPHEDRGRQRLWRAGMAASEAARKEAGRREPLSGRGLGVMGRLARLTCLPRSTASSPTR